MHTKEAAITKIVPARREGGRREGGHVVCCHANGGCARTCTKKRAPMHSQNIDTDQIIPAEFLTLVPSKVVYRKQALSLTHTHTHLHCQEVLARLDEVGHVKLCS